MRLLPLAALLLLATPALAQDETPSEPPPQTKPLLPPNPPPAAQQEEKDDPAPMRLSAIISQAASVQKRARITDGVLGIVAGSGGIVTGSILFTLQSVAGNDGTKILGGIAIGFGGLTVLTSALDLFSRSALERLDEAYAPIAVDKSIPADKRLAEGENALESMANSGRSSRIFSGVTSIVLGVGLGIAAAPIAFAVIPDSSPDHDTLRAYVGLGFGLSAFIALASGITTIVVKRTEAEQLWSLWLAGTGRAPQSKATPFKPYVTASGIGMSF